MIIASYVNWYCPCIDIDEYMNLYFYSQRTYDELIDVFGYQNMFVTLEIFNKMYREDY